MRLDWYFSQSKMDYWIELSAPVDIIANLETLQLNKFVE